MKLNKTVLLEDGGEKLCEYDTDDIALAALWTTIFAISLALNIFAIVGNSIIIMACFLQKHRPSLIIYIHALAFSDFIYSILAPFYTYRYVLQYWPNAVINFWLVGKFAHGFAVYGNICSTLSSWLIVALTIDRLILVKLPTKSHTWSSAKRTYIVIVTIVLLSVAVNAPYIFEQNEVSIFINDCSGYWGIPKVITREDNSTYIPLRYDKSYQLYTIISSVLVFYVIPTLIMIVCNVIIVKQLNAKKLSETTQAKQRRLSEARLTKMIIVLSICYIVCNLPDLVTRLLWRFLPPQVVGKVQPVAHLFLMINVGANFVIYSLFNKHLFATVTTMCCKCCGHSNAVSSVVQVQSSGTKSTSASA